MKIGIAGYGRMGAAIAARLQETGPAPLLWNRSKPAAAPLEGAEFAETPAALARACDLVITLVAGEDANRAIYGGPDGLLAAGGEGALLVNASTLSPGFVRALAAESAAAGARFLEAPVLGTVAPAREGRLVALLGGEPALVEAARPGLERFCRAVTLVGPVGAGAAMKIVHNSILSLYWRAVSEAFGYGRSQGLAIADMVDVVGDSFAANKQWPLKASMLKGQDSAVGFPIAGLAKELALFETLYAEAPASAAMIALARARADAAVAAGWGDRDVASIVLFQE